MHSYTQMLGLDAAPRFDMVRRDDGVLVCTGVIAFGDEVVEAEGNDPNTADYRAWLAAGGKLGAPVPSEATAYGDDLIAALSDAELTALSGGTPRDQRMLSAQRAPFRAADDIIVRLAVVMHIDPAAWLARVPKAAR